MTNPLFDRLFGRHHDNAARFLLLPDGSQISYAAFVRRAGQLAGALAGLGLEPGDRVAVQVAKSPDALALYAACVQRGLVFLPLNTAYTPNELEYFVSNSGARLLVASPDPAPELVQVAEGAGARLETMGADGTGSLCGLAAGAMVPADAVPRRADDLAAILYTSGTTGRSKGAMLTGANLLSNAQVLTDLWRFTDADVLLHGLPIFHTHGLFVATNITLLAGGAMILLPNADTGAMLAQMPKATAMMGVPTFYTRLLDQPGFGRETAGHMRLFISGSAPLLAETHRRFEARTGHRILERYGMTETNMSTSNPYDGPRKPGTVGTALPGVDLRICDAQGREVAQGEIGIIEVRGPNVFAGYWQMPDKTAAEMRADGFFVTGDLGFADADGYVTIVGRSKDLIISGGFNIYPKEVEEAIDALPGVLESAVIGAPHPDLGEVPLAVVVPEPGHMLRPEDITEGLAGVLARFKRPRQVILAEALPRNAMGKVQKAALRRAHGGG